MTDENSNPKKHPNKVGRVVILLLWLALLSTAGYIWYRSGIQLKEIPQLLHNWLGEFGVAKAASIYIFLYTIRPLIFFPATLLTVASGLIFGPFWGIVFTIIGENFSANFAFYLARRLGRDWVEQRENEQLERWERKLSENGMVTVLIMRLIYLPFDGVNFGCGLTSMKQRDFAIGTFIGILPGLISFVLLGGTVAANVQQRLAVFAGSAFFFVLGLIIARLLRKTPAAEG